MSNATAVQGAARVEDGEVHGMAPETQSRHEEYVERIGAAVRSDMSNGEVSALLDDFTEVAVRLVPEERAAA